MSDLLLKMVPLLIAAGSLTVNVVQYRASRADKLTESKPHAYFVLASDSRIVELFNGKAEHGLAVTPAAGAMKEFADMLTTATTGSLRTAPTGSFVAVCNPTGHPIEKVRFQLDREISVASLAPTECIYTAIDFVAPTAVGTPRLPASLSVRFADADEQSVEIHPETPVAWMRSNEVRAVIRHKR
jgi:hypothetical protein